MTDSTTDDPTNSARIDRRALILGGLLAVGGSAAIARQPRSDMARLDKDQLGKLVPTTFGDWTARADDSLVVPPADALSDKLYSGLLTRSYTAPGRRPVMLLVAYSNLQDGMLQVHRPEVCYPAGGYRLSNTEPVELKVNGGHAIAANAFSADGISRTEQILYWTRIGREYPRRWIEQRLAVLRANLHGWIPDGVLVRASMLDSDMADALPDLSGFADALIAAATPAGRRILGGA